MVNKVLCEESTGLHRLYPLCIARYRRRDGKYVTIARRKFIKGIPRGPYKSLQQWISMQIV